MLNPYSGVGQFSPVPTSHWMQKNPPRHISWASFVASQSGFKFQSNRRLSECRIKLFEAGSCNAFLKLITVFKEAIKSFVLDFLQDNKKFKHPSALIQEGTDVIYNPANNYSSYDPVPLRVGWLL